MAFPSQDRFDAITARFRDQRVLVIGDLMLDRYIWGDTARISPEAPVPVIEARDETLRLGGAANVAHNVRALGGTPILVGVVGEDASAQELRDLLTAKAIPLQGLVIDRTRRTTAKTRVLARHQQVVRIDHEDLHEIEGPALNDVRARLEHALTEATACVISDYGKGVITRALLEPFLAAAHARGLPIAVDPKETHFFAYRGAATLTPNTMEAGAAYGRRIKDVATLIAAGNYLREQLESRSVLITRGEHGMALFRAGEPPINFPAMAREVFDVTGAGDTVVSTFALALGAGADLAEAAALSNHAAGIVVREVGTAATNIETLGAAFREAGDRGDPRPLIDARTAGEH